MVESNDTSFVSLLKSKCTRLQVLLQSQSSKYAKELTFEQDFVAMLDYQSELLTKLKTSLKANLSQMNLYSGYTSMDYTRGHSPIYSGTLSRYGRSGRGSFSKPKTPKLFEESVDNKTNTASNQSSAREQLLRANQEIFLREKNRETSPISLSNLSARKKKKPDLPCLDSLSPSKGAGLGNLGGLGTGKGRDRIQGHRGSQTERNIGVREEKGVDRAMSHLNSTLKKLGTWTTRDRKQISTSQVGRFNRSSSPKDQFSPDHLRRRSPHNVSIGQVGTKININLNTKNIFGSGGAPRSSRVKKQSVIERRKSGSSQKKKFLKKPLPVLLTPQGQVGIEVPKPTPTGIVEKPERNTPFSKGYNSDRKEYTASKRAFEPGPVTKIQKKVNAKTNSKVSEDDFIRLQSIKDQYTKKTQPGPKLSHKNPSTNPFSGNLGESQITGLNSVRRNTPGPPPTQLSDEDEFLKKEFSDPNSLDFEPSSIGGRPSLNLHGNMKDFISFKDLQSVKNQEEDYPQGRGKVKKAGNLSINVGGFLAQSGRGGSPKDLSGINSLNLSSLTPADRAKYIKMNKLRCSIGVVQDINRSGVERLKDAALMSSEVFDVQRGYDETEGTGDKNRRTKGVPQFSTKLMQLKLGSNKD